MAGSLPPGSSWGLLRWVRWCGFGLAATGFALLVLVPVLLVALFPHAMARHELVRNGRDPWGGGARPAYPGMNQADYFFYSAGPNRLDERGKGDDVVVLMSEWDEMWVGPWEGTNRAPIHRLSAVAFFAAWLTIALPPLYGPRGETRREVWNAALATSLPALAAIYLTLLCWGPVMSGQMPWDRRLEGLTRISPLVPPTVALGLTLLGVWFGAALAWRLRRQRACEPSPG